MDEAEVPQGLYLIRKMYLLNESQRAPGQCCRLSYNILAQFGRYGLVLV